MALQSRQGGEVDQQTTARTAIILRQLTVIVVCVGDRWVFRIQTTYVRTVLFRHIYFRSAAVRFFLTFWKIFATREKRPFPKQNTVPYLIINLPSCFFFFVWPIQNDRFVSHSSTHRKITLHKRCATTYTTTNSINQTTEKACRQKHQRLICIQSTIRYLD